MEHVGCESFSSWISAVMLMWSYVIMCLCPKPLAKMEAVDRGGADVQCQNLKFKF